MVTVTIEGNSFKVKGTFDCGILGVFRDDLIQIGCDDVQDIRDSGLSGIDTLTCSDEELSAYITDLANQQEAKLTCCATGQEVKLGAKEYQIMELFARHPGFVFSTEHLMDKIWGYETDSEIDVVWTHIGYVRKKLRSIGAHVEIKTIRGAGYALEVTAC